MREERLERLPLNVGTGVLSEITKAVTIQHAISILVCYGTEDALAIIDNLDQLTAAFILSYIRFQARNGDNDAKKFVARADELHIRGSRGLVYARDKVYRETGFFAGI